MELRESFGFEVPGDDMAPSSLHLVEPEVCRPRDGGSLK